MNLDKASQYTKSKLEREMLDENPFVQFEKWFAEAKNAEIKIPNAMSLATATASGIPSVRTVLLKVFDEKGFVFFTNYNSRKSQEIQANPNAALLFPWLDLERQIRINGQVEKISTEESLRYFATRPRDSQLGAWVSNQSAPIASRSILKMKMEELQQKFQGGEIPLPDFWGGYRVVPHTFEFWQGRKSRLHDRFQYQKPEDGKNWVIERLAP